MSSPVRGASGGAYGAASTGRKEPYGAEHAPGAEAPCPSARRPIRSGARVTISRRGAARWAEDPPTGRVAVDVLIPTAGRVAELAVTLAALAAQDDPPFRVVISDQSEDGTLEAPAVQAMVRTLRAQGRPVHLHRHRTRRGLAEHRQSLLERATADAVLFLDDDVWLEPGHLARLADALETLGCGFVGSAVQGLSYLADRRPGECASFEPWPDAVLPERAAVHLAGQVDVLRAQPAEEPAHLSGIVLLRGPVDAASRRQHLHARDRTRASVQEGAVRGGAQQHDLGLGVGRRQRVDRREGEHEVAEPAAAQHRDPAHVREPGRQRADDRAAGPRGRAGAHETSGVQDPPASRAEVPSTSAGSRSARAGTRTDAVAAAPALT